VKSKAKEEQTSRIHKELKEAYNLILKRHINTDTTTIVWLRSKPHCTEVKKMREMLHKIVR
jgi:hypothetical protein